MNRKDYQKPAMKVIKLQQRTQILRGSETPPLRKPDDYEEGEDVLGF